MLSLEKFRSPETTAHAGQMFLLQRSSSRVPSKEQANGFRAEELFVASRRLMSVELVRAAEYSLASVLFPSARRLARRASDRDAAKVDGLALPSERAVRSGHGRSRVDADGLAAVASTGVPSGGPVRRRSGQFIHHCRRLHGFVTENKK
jgi:hypothetical protein